MSAEHPKVTERPAPVEKPLAELRPDDPERRRRIDALAAKLVQEDRDILIALAKR